MPTISIIVPIYNSELTLDKCISSILQMEFTDYELLLVDDGSIDNSWGICRKWAERDSRIRAFQQENRGPSVARNHGIKECSGKWIVFVDSDDIVRSRYVSDLLETAEKHSSIVMAISGEQVYRNDKKAEVVHFPDVLCKVNDYKTLWKELRLHFYGHPFGKLYRRVIIEHNHLQFDNNVCLGEDCIFMMQYIMACASLRDSSIAFISNSNYDYYVHSGSLSSSRLSVKQEEANYKSYRSTVIKLKETFRIDEDTFTCLYAPVSFYADRVFNAIDDIPTQRERLLHMNIVNREEYSKYKVAPTWIASVIKWLYVSRCWYLYDVVRQIVK